MVRICRLLKIILMTLVTIGIVKLVISTDMAILALCRNMFAGERKSGSVMVKCRRLPGDSRVARNAIVAETAGGMIRRACRCIIG